MWEFSRKGFVFGKVYYGFRGSLEEGWGLEVVVWREMVWGLVGFLERGILLCNFYFMVWGFRGYRLFVGSVGVLFLCFFV